MIGQCLSNKNESAAVGKFKFFSQQNKALKKKMHIYRSVVWLLG